MSYKETLEKIDQRLEFLEKNFENKKEIKEEKEKTFDFVKDLDTIFILGRGQSLGRCPGQIPAKSEFWGCNNVYRARKLSRLFIIRDPYITQHQREPKLIEEINSHEFPVYTLGSYPEFKNNARYPLNEVIEEFSKTGEGGSYLLNTASYMIALAIMQRPKQLLLFGIDLTYGTNNEYMYNQKACCEAWVGMAHGRGIKFGVAEGSTLLKRRINAGSQFMSNFYGYETIDDGISQRLKPKWSWGNPEGKCAIRYKMVKIHHTL